MRTTCGIVALALVASLIAVATLQAMPAGADSGYVGTLASFQVSLGHDTGTLTLATTEFVPSVGVVAAPDPSVDWGDNTSSGASVPALGTCTECDLQGSHLYTQAGHFTITITYYTGCCVSYTTQTSVDVIAPTDHFVMAGIGDSASSGEGNPDQPIEYDAGFIPKGPAIWDDGTGTFGSDPGTSKCHRSKYAPSAEAAQRIQQENITTSIDYTLLGCTGAIIGIPLDQEIAQGNNITTNDTAIKQISHLPPGHIDALVMMVGANNLDNGYSNVIETCLKDNVEVPFRPPCEQDTALTGRVASDMANLQTYYNYLAAAIQARGNIGKVYITEYFDPTHDANGNYDSGACTFGAMTAASWQWSHDSVVVPLNNNVAEAAAAHGWTFVGGITDQFRDHGFCAWPQNQNWVVALDSLTTQGDIDGTAHANHPGQEVYRDAITSAIYRGTPPTTTASAGPYTFGTFTNQNVQVTLTAHNPLPKSGVGKTYYAVDDPSCTPAATATCQTYNSAFTVSGNGNHTVSFFSQNLYGTPEQLKTVSVNIDTAPPTAAAGTGGYTLGTWTKNSVSITLHAVDAGSGVQSVTYSASGGQTITQTSVLGDTASFVIANEGQTQVSYFATDNVGNVENTKSITVKVDKIAPTIADTGATSAPTGHDSFNLPWYNHPVTEGWTANDAESGLAPPLSGATASFQTTTSGEGTGITPGSGPVSDVAGNTNPGITSTSYNIDMTKPTVAATGKSGAYTFGQWTTGPVPVHFSCTDPATLGVIASGVAQCPADTTVTAEGTSTVGGTASDYAGNVSDPFSATVKIDNTPPVTLASVPVPDISGIYTTAVPVTISPSDSLSGVAATYWSDNGAPYTTVTSSGSSFAVTLQNPSTGPTQHTLTYYSVDIVGNVEGVHMLPTITIDQRAPLTVASAACTGTSIPPYSTIGDLTVPDGASCVLDQVTVTHDLKVGHGSSLTAYGLKVARDFQADHSGAISLLAGGIIGRDMHLDTVAGPTGANPAVICGVSIGHDFSLTNSTGSWTIGGSAGCKNTVGHDAQLQNNRGSVIFSYNHVVHDLNGNNNAHLTLGNNQVDGSTNVH